MIEPARCLQAKAIVVLVGPTAVGKSGIAIHVAKALGTEVLAADSRQVYRGMDIATDKPSSAERGGVPHRLIDLVAPDEPFNVGLYRRAAEREIARLHEEGKVPLIVGGTGLYVRALVRGLCDGPQADPTLRAELEAEAHRIGPVSLHQELARVDPASAGRLHPHDRVKIIRALEVYRQTGRPLSELHQGHGFTERPFATLLVGLMRERAALYTRIEARIDAMLGKGLVEETRRLLAQGYSRKLGAMKGLGYKQIAGYLAGEYGYDEAVRRLKRDTRQFAKRQLTWFRKEAEITWLALDEATSEPAVASRVLELIREFLAGLRPETAGVLEQRGS